MIDNNLIIFIILILILIFFCVYIDFQTISFDEYKKIWIQINKGEY